MTLDEVNQIFGFDGTKAASGSASAAGMSSTAEVYTWSIFTSCVYAQSRVNTGCFAARKRI